MSLFLGIDTSNYTTSAALYDSESKTVIQRKKLLPVKEGQLGLRQSDAVFHHTAQLHSLFEELVKDVDTRLQDKINEYGEITKLEDLGIKKLAYEINKFKEGHYFLYEFKVEDSKKGEVIQETERLCRITEEIIKFITVRID